MSRLTCILCDKKSQICKSIKIREDNWLFCCPECVREPGTILEVCCRCEKNAPYYKPLSGSGFVCLLCYIDKAIASEFQQ